MGPHLFHKGGEMNKETFLEKLEKFLDELPEPLVEPVWYPNIPGQERAVDFIEKLGEVLKMLMEAVVRAMRDEGFFDENPLIRVYPNYPEASGIVIFYKGQKIFEKWVNSFELNFGDREKVKRNAEGWYDEMIGNMSPEEYEYYFYDQVPPWEKRRW
jgi:hypothetical protein